MAIHHARPRRSFLRHIRTYFFAWVRHDLIVSLIIHKHAHIVIHYMDEQSLDFQQFSFHLGKQKCGGFTPPLLAASLRRGSYENLLSLLHDFNSPYFVGRITCCV